MRVHYLILLAVLIIILIVCCIITYKRINKHNRQLYVDVINSLVGCMLAMFGNVTLVRAAEPTTAMVGYYIFFIGTDFLFVYLIDYSVEFCNYTDTSRMLFKAVMITAIIDFAQLTLNFVTHHAFAVERTVAQDGDLYYSVDSYIGHYIHLIYNAFLIAIILTILIQKMYRVPRAYKEKYLFIILSIMISVVWETYYVLLEKPFDTSMAGYAISGIFVFYFTVIYNQRLVIGALHAKVVDELTNAIIFFDMNDECIYANDAAYEMFGTHEFSRDGFRSRVAEILSDDSIDYRRDFTRKRGTAVEGEIRFYDIEYHYLKDSKERYIGSFYSIRDCTDDEMEAREKRYRASHDTLTGLYNKDYFIERVERRLRKDVINNYYIVATDIRDFKMVNDIYGSEKGDEVLRAIADGIREHAQRNTIYCRLSADRFGLLVRKSDFRSDVYIRETEKVLSKYGSRFKIVIHVGVYEVTDRTLPVTLMLDRANMAIAGIKGEYSCRIAFYDDALRESRLWESEISENLPEALAENQIVPYLQPQINDRGELEGAEVLVRWNHPKEGFLLPQNFVPVFEKNGMIYKVDMFMWESACKLLRRWSDAGNDKLYLSVNISPKDFYFVDVYEEITSLVKRYGVNPGRLHLELTESAVMTNFEARVKMIKRFMEAGFLVEMDDFGSGYSSLNMLKDMPIDVLKIDMMFVQETGESEKARVILESVVEMSKRLGIPSIAEGVETKEQVEMLIKMGCRLFQGYYFSKPLSVEEFEEKTKNGMKQ